MSNSREQPKSILQQRNAAWLEGRASVASGDSILVADDSDTDNFFLFRAFTSAKVRNPISLVRNGVEARDYLAGVGPFSDRVKFPVPRIVFLDLKLPGMSGFEILQWKQSRSELFPVLFIAMSNFDTLGAINEAYDAGANTFLSKPVHPHDIREIIGAYETYWTLGANKKATPEAQPPSKIPIS